MSRVIWCASIDPRLCLLWKFQQARAVFASLTNPCTAPRETLICLNLVIMLPGLFHNLPGCIFGSPDCNAAYHKESLRYDVRNSG
jgi:hypothetical protein